MKASVQYNDFTGTAAADISDYCLNSMDRYLEQKFSNFYPERYTCIGVEMYASYKHFMTIQFICHDLQDGRNVRMRPKEEVGPDVFFEMFKRFSVVIGKNIDDVNIDDSAEDLILF